MNTLFEVYELLTSGVPEQKSFETEQISERNSQIARNKFKEQIRDFCDHELNCL